MGDAGQSGCLHSTFITRLTGISNEMVREAPSFGDVAHRLYSFLEGAVLAAHHVRFDYGFLKNEYRRIGALLKNPSLPSGLDASILDQIPDTPGVYSFYRKNGLLYIGKSVNLRSRVMSHFNGDHASFSDMRIAQEVERVEWTEMAGELGALLLESRLIKERQPIHNKRLRRSRTLFSLRLADGSDQV